MHPKILAYILAFIFVSANLTFIALPYAMEEIPFSKQTATDHPT